MKATKGRVVVVGGGVMGLSVAYNLLRSGVYTRIVERSYLNAGSTGRNMGIVKQRIPHRQMETRRTLAALAKQSLKLHASLSSETGINTFYRESGCLMLAKTPEEEKILEEESWINRELGIKEGRLTAGSINKNWPYINSKNIIAGFYSPVEAMVHPFGLTWAYVESIKRMGGIIEKESAVTAIQENGSGYIVKTSSGEYNAETLVITAGVASEPLLETLGHKLHLTPYRREMLISEPLRPFLGPTITRPSRNYIIAQTMRGEIMGSIGEQNPGYDLSEVSSDFLSSFADETLSILPAMRHLRIIRQWVGITEKTKDGSPYVGQLNNNLYTACGFYDTGITLAPVLGRLLAKSIEKGGIDSQLRSFNPLRST